MSLEAAYRILEQASEESLDWFQHEIASLRTGRVTTNLIEPLIVEHYGSRTPLKGLASISAADARTIVINPWDPSALPAIQKAITDANLGVNPSSDGKLIRLSFPMQSEEMREQTIKQLHRKAEDTRVRLRQGRDEALVLLKHEKQESALTEDDFYEGKEHLDALISKANSGIDAIIKKKEEDIRTI